MKAAHGHKASSALSADLKVRVDRIGDEGLDLDEVISPAWVGSALGEGSAFSATREGRLILRLEKAEEVVRVRGRAMVSLASACVRCLTPTPLALDVPVDLVMFPRGQEPEAGAAGELGDDDMGVASYDEGVLDLASVVHDEVFLELPMNPLCSETCAGLCPQCGANLNEACCGCVAEIDPRWETLRNLDKKAD